jgi:hypothetical protein
MVNAISTNNINPIQMLNALSAFKAADNVQDTNKIPETSDGIDINDNNVLKNQDTDEIKQFAQVAGEDNLSDEDIQYGITYGRSVIADYAV